MKRNPLFLVAGLALLIGILRLPYGYYQLLRIFICAIGAYGAYLSYDNDCIAWCWILGSIAVIFNPLIKIYFSKETWQVIDLIAAITFFIFYTTSASKMSKNKT